jgi:hypothetical protein
VIPKSDKIPSNCYHQTLTQNHSLPGALAMYGLSLGVERINETLPPPVYALLSGLNASTVGIIALAAVQLAEKAIKDKLTRILVIFGACAGVCYNALWYFPVLLVFGGLTTLTWEGYLQKQIEKIKAQRRRRRSHQSSMDVPAESPVDDTAIPLEENVSSSKLTQRRTDNSLSIQRAHANTQVSTTLSAHSIPETPVKGDHAVRIPVGISVLVAFFSEYF